MLCHIISQKVPNHDSGLSMEIQICSVVPARVLILGLPRECWPLTSDADLV